MLLLPVMQQGDSTVRQPAVYVDTDADDTDAITAAAAAAAA
jgi:hypothetical protein